MAIFSSRSALSSAVPPDVNGRETHRTRARVPYSWLGPFVSVVLSACSSSSGTGHPDRADAAAGAGGTSNRDAAASSGGIPSGAGGTTLRDASADGSPILGDATVDAGPPGRYLWQVFYDQTIAAHVVVDSKGAAIVSGQVSAANDVTLGGFELKRHGSSDTVLSRVLPDSTVDWARTYGGTAEEYPVKFVLDAQDRILLTGLYNGTGNIGGPDFPAFAGNPGRYDVYLAGLAANGDYRWSRTINTNADGFGSGVDFDAAGNALLAGSFLGTGTIGGVAHASAGGWDGFLARYDGPSGTFATATTFGGTGDDKAFAPLFTGTDVIVVGTFQGSITLPTVPSSTTLISAGGADIFVLRASTAGVMSSAVSFGGTGDEQIAQTHLDPGGNVVIAGTFNSPTLSVLGGKAMPTAGRDDFFVTKLSPKLAHLWSVRFGGDADDLVRDLAVGSDGSVAITGEFRDQLTIGDRVWEAAREADSGPTTNIDIFVAKLDAAGNPTWSFAAGGPAPDRGLSVAEDATGAVYLAATFESPTDFGGGVVLTPEAGQSAGALVRYAP